MDDVRERPRWLFQRREMAAARRRGEVTADQLRHLELGRLQRTARGAAVRGIAFELTAAWFVDHMNAPCFYCGGDVEPSSCGVDRMDPEIGYTAANSVPCCSWCNKAKLTLTADEWLRVIGPAVEKHGAGKIWPTRRVGLSGVERERRKSTLSK